jgi:hypothetical protein
VDGAGRLRRLGSLFDYNVAEGRGGGWLVLLMFWLGAAGTPFHLYPFCLWMFVVVVVWFVVRG